MPKEPTGTPAEGVIPIPGAGEPDTAEAAEALAGFPGGLGAFPAPEEDSPDADDKPRRGRPRRGRRARRDAAPVVSRGPSKQELMQRVAALEGELAALSPERQALVEAQEGHVRVALGMTFAAAAKGAGQFYGDYWELADAERDALVDAWFPVILPYIGSIGAAFPYIAAASTTYTVLAPRLMEMKRRREVGALPAAPVELADGEPIAAERPAPSRRGGK